MEFSFKNSAFAWDTFSTLSDVQSANIDCNLDRGVFGLADVMDAFKEGEFETAEALGFSDDIVGLVSAFFSILSRRGDNASESEVSSETGSSLFFF